MTRHAMIGVAAFAVSVAAACGGGSGSRSATPVSDEAFRERAQAAATAALLTIDDFPAGWEAEPPEPDDDEEEDTPDGLSPECTELFALIDEMEASAESDAVASAASDDFSSAYSLHNVSTEVEVYRTVELASQGEDLFDSLFDTCGDEMGPFIEEEINRDAAEEGEGFRVSNFEILDLTKRDLADFGRDWGFRATYHVEGLAIDATFTATFVRAGRTTGTFMYLWSDEPDEALIPSLRDLFASRLAEADAKLPE